MEKDKKNYGKSILVVLLLLITMVALVFATYAWARYTSTASGNVRANIARWDVTLSSDTTRFVRTYEHVVTGKMAPGTEGQIDIALAANDTDVNFDFELALNDVNNLNNKPAHVLFYRTRTENGGTVTFSDPIGSAADTLKGRVTVVDSSDGSKLPTPQIQFITGYSNDTTPVPTYSTATNLTGDAGNLTIYWTWPYDLQGYMDLGGTILNVDPTNQTPVAAPTPGITGTALADAIAAYDKQDTDDAKDFNETPTEAGQGNANNNNAISAKKQMVVNFTLTATQTRPTPTTY